MDLSWQALAWRGVALGFLPRGYPHTIAGRYMPYVGWTSLGLFAGRMQGVLATQAALFAAGLSAGAIPMAVAVQWVLKDGVGHAGAIVYAASVNTRFDADAKRYRFHSTLALTLADFIAVLMPFAPQHFFVMASLSSTTSSIANLAQVSARARIMSSFAVQGNLADCVRAGQTQGKLVSIFGTAAGAGLSWVLGPEPVHVCCTMVPLAAVSLYAMFESSRLVALRTLNEQRAELLFAALADRLEQAGRLEHCAGHPGHGAFERAGGAFARAGAGAAAAAPRHADVSSALSSSQGDGGQCSIVAPSPADVAVDEAFVQPYTSTLHGELWLQPLFPTAAAAAAPMVAFFAPLGRLRAGGAGGRPADATALAAALPALEAALAGAGAPTGSHPAADVADGRRVHAGGAWRASWCAEYAIAACIPPGADGARVAVWHAADAAPADKMRAVWHATLLRRQRSGGDEARAGLAPIAGACALSAAMEAASDAAHDTWPEVHEALEAAGWDLGSSYLDGEGGCMDVSTAPQSASREASKT